MVAADIGPDRTIGSLCFQQRLRVVEDVLVDDAPMLALVDELPVADFADIDRVREQVLELALGPAIARLAGR